MPQQQMTQQQQAVALNAQARALIKANAVKMEQQVFGGNFVPANSPTVNIVPRNVGLIKGFYVQVELTISNASAVQINLTDFGPLNALAQINFLDLQNNTRIQTPGWHVGLVNSAKVRRPYGTALVRTTGFDSPIDYGSLWGHQISAPATIAAAGTGTVIMWYYVPLAYSDDDLRGAIYANVIQSTMQLNLTFPGQGFGSAVAVASGADSTLALYVGNAAGAVTAVTITNALINVWQCYADQIPATNQGVILPLIDLSTVYELKQTTLAAVVANQDFPYQYSNYRDFLSTFAVYVNTAATGARGVGADINYWSLQSANFTNIWKKSPALIALQNRNIMSVDFPPGVYYFPTREKPISTTQYGNMQLINNPLTAGVGAYEMVATEAFALQQTLSTAGSLAAS